VGVAVAVDSSGVGESVSVEIGFWGLLVSMMNFLVEVAEGVADGEGGMAEGIVLLMFPSARDNERPPKRRPKEARAIKIPRSTGHKFFISGSLPASLPGPA
jgi:hypothetical protein